MKRLFLFCFLFFSLTAQAADIEATAVILRGVDKITGRTHTNQIEIGKPVQIHNIRITAQRCLKKPPEETPENAAFLLIEEEKNHAYQVIFNGWMFSSNPAISSLEHPVFDVWVLDCLAPDDNEEWENKNADSPLVLSTDKVQIEALENID